MRAVVWTRYGPPEVLQLQDVPRPMPRDDEVLVRAASINSWDNELLDGVAQITVGGRRRPPHRILGCDIAETAEAFRYYREGRFTGKIVVTMRG